MEKYHSFHIGKESSNDCLGIANDRGDNLNRDPGPEFELAPAGERANDWNMF